MFFSKTTLGWYPDEMLLAYEKSGKCPKDLVKVPNEVRDEMLDGERIGMMISADENGFPILTDPSPPSESDLAKKQIAEIEASITDRRLREAMLSTAGQSWLTDRDAEISALRAKIV